MQDGVQDLRLFSTLGAQVHIHCMFDTNRQTAKQEDLMMAERNGHVLYGR